MSLSIALSKLAPHFEQDHALEAPAWFQPTDVAKKGMAMSSSHRQLTIRDLCFRYNDRSHSPCNLPHPQGNACIEVASSSSRDGQHRSAPVLPGEHFATDGVSEYHTRSAIAYFTAGHWGFRTLTHSISLSFILDMRRRSRWYAKQLSTWDTAHQEESPESEMMDSTTRNDDVMYASLPRKAG